MSAVQTGLASLALFCKVVDNYGDIGICWRLSRQLQREHGIAVTLWVDDLQSFKRICTDVAVDADVQVIDGVTVRHWRNQGGVFAAGDIADIVIEFFACDIPPGYIEAMAQCNPRPVWLNLEGLTAEEWVEGCHTLPSSHPRLPLTKYFFFPGFTGKTGGLLYESDLDARRRQFQADAVGMTTFLAQFGVTPAEMAAQKVSLFCYPHAPVSFLFDAWRNAAAPITCMVPQGVAVQAVEQFLQQPATPGIRPDVRCADGAGAPFVSQQDYDRLLWACDLNFVRGEDSFVRAQWAGRPFIWHIYPQDENLHHKKLRAFLQRYAGGIEPLTAAASQWNGAGDESASQPSWTALWSKFQAEMPALTHRAAEWQRQMLENGDLTSNLLQFARQVRMNAAKT